MRACVQQSMGLTGLWIGIATGDTVACAMCLVSWMCVRWPHECAKARSRVLAGERCAAMP